MKITHKLRRSLDCTRKGKEQVEHRNIGHERVAWLHLLDRGYCFYMIN